jgi:polyribonucleotide nucleotidyltransferase
MASVCGSSLSLMAAGVPIKAACAGIAMGLIKEGDDYVVLSDIAGVEDHLGDMDFKVAGTKDGITALQMDIKITGVSFDILRDALEQAKAGREFILGKMNEVISEPREQLSEHAPRISSIKIDQDKIGMVIGKGGETIRSLSDEFEAQIDMQEDGTVLIYAATGAQADALVDRIRTMTKEVEVGDEFKGKVVKTTTFGAFVELTKGTDGLLHISNAKPGERVESVEDVLNRGDEIDVRVVEVDKERGRIGLRLADDPEIAGKTAEELISVGTGDKGGETIRGLSEEFESQIDVNDDGQMLVYSANGELGEKLADRITSMLKDVEVGDEFPNAKVVKTTTFGAFVELSKGTDGLLHISNVSPGQRVDTVEDVLNKGDEISVRVVEVDRERGRIGLRLAEDPEIAGKSVEELAAVGGGGGGGGDRGPRRDRNGGGRDRDRERGPRGSGRPRHGAGRDRD